MDQDTPTNATGDVAWEPPHGANGASGPPDTALIGTDGAIVKAHRTVLCVCTEIFDALLSITEDDQASDKTPEGLSIVKMHETSAVLAVVIPFCYNIEGPDLMLVSHDLMMQAYEAAHKFVCLRALERINAEFGMRFSQNDRVVRDPGPVQPPSPLGLLQGLGTVAGIGVNEAQALSAKAKTIIKALEVYAMAKRFDDRQLLNLSRGRAWQQYDLNKPFFLLEEIGIDDITTFLLSKQKARNSLNVLLTKAAGVAPKVAKWKCCTPELHASLMETWTNAVNKASTRLNESGRNLTLVIHRPRRPGAPPAMQPNDAERVGQPECFLAILDTFDALHRSWTDVLRPHM